MNTPARIHFADNILINPTNPITVNLIGAGGTGSRMLTCLMQTSASLIGLGHTGLHVNLYDDDLVTHANIGRQLFSESEVGLQKSVALINRVNRSCGAGWKAVTQRFSFATLRHAPNYGSANIFISCVDTIAARFDIANALGMLKDNKGYSRDRPLYWMDCGNGRHTGQVVLSTVSQIRQPKSELYEPVADLPFVTTEFKNLLEAQIDNDEPSCSLAEALEKQDLFINPAIASMGASLLWNLFREGMTENRGFFMNLKDFIANPIKV